MSPWITFLISQGLVWGPLVLGHQARRRRWIRPEWAGPLQFYNLMIGCTLIYGLGVWRLEPGQSDWMRVMWVQVITLAILTMAGVWLAPRLAREFPGESRRRATGTLTFMIPNGNTGFTLAGFITLLLISDTAYAYNAVIQIPVTLYIFMIWIPLARFWSREPLARHALLREYRKVFISAQMIPVAGMFAGVGLHAAAVPMDRFWIELLRWAVLVSTAVTMFGIGMRLHVRRLWGYQRVLVPVYLLKFVFTPCVMIGLTYAFGLSGTAAGALIIVSCMPSGVLSVSIPQIYDLDVDLGNAGYLGSTLLFMLFILPLLVWLVPRLI